MSNPVFGGPNDFHIEDDTLQPGLGNLPGSRAPIAAVAEPPDKAELRARDEELRAKARQLSTVERELVKERAAFAAEKAAAEAELAEREAAVAEHARLMKKGVKS